MSTDIIKLIPVGIDVGSLHARVAIVEQEEAKIVSNTLGHRSTLSCVVQEQHDDSSHVVFGLAAKKLAAKQKNQKHVMVHDCLQNPENEDLCQAFMGHLARLASDATSALLTELRITLSVPVDASDNFIESLTRATKLGIRNQGIKKKHSNAVVVGVLVDATAVCVAHGLTDKENQQDHYKSILVIDWGALGLKMSSLEYCGSSNMLVVTGTSRHEDLSGQVLSEIFAKHVASQFERKNRLSPGQVWDNTRARNKLLDECEASLKTMNSGNGSVHVTMDGLYEGIDCHVGVSRPRWEMLTSSLLSKANEVLQNAATIQKPQVVLLAGSVGLMPSAQQLVDKVFAGVYRGRSNVPPHEAVALGCARHAAHAVEIMQDRKTLPVAPILSNICVSPIALGLVREHDSNDSTAVTLIGRGTPLPAHVVHTFCSESGETWSLWQLTPTSKLVAKIEDLPGSGEEVELLVELSTTGSLALAVQGGDLVHIEN